MKLGFIILAHEPFEKIRPLLSVLTKNKNDVVALHFDKSTSHEKDIELVKECYPNIVIVNQEKVEWGEPSIVDATLNGINAILDSEFSPEYITLLSGSCFPIKSRCKFEEYLLENKGSEFIECHDISNSRWVKSGLEEKRWQHYHFVNWRKNPNLFGFIDSLQNRLKINRKFPFGNKMYMGTQWWTLSYDTLSKISMVSNDKKIKKFLKTTWIPDEFYFQSLVANLINNELISTPHMHYKFNDFGIPKLMTYFDLNEITRSDSFFCRKVNHNDSVLLECLSDTYIKGTSIPIPYKEDELTPVGNKGVFNSGIVDYKLPIIIVIDANSDSHCSMFDIAQVISGFDDRIKCYGDIFHHNKIYYNVEDELPLYNSDDIHIRDYSHQGFLSDISSHANYGFCFKLSSRHLLPIADELSSHQNVVFFDLCHNIN